MPIYKTALVSSFSQDDNVIFFDEAIPPKAKLILMYLLAKPSHWNLRIGDIKKRLAMGSCAARNGLNWLQKAGFIYYERLTTGHTVWHIFDRPQTVATSTAAACSPTKSPKIGYRNFGNLPVLDILKKTDILKTPPLPTPVPELTAAPIPKPMVVVDVLVSDELIYPEQLTEPQKKQAKYVIKKCEPQLQQAVLFALAYAITAGRVKSPVAYLNGLITRANNGTFEPINAPGAAHRTKPLIPIWTEHKVDKVDNEQHFKDLINRYGDKAAKVINAVRRNP